MTQINHADHHALLADQDDDKQSLACTGNDDAYNDEFADAYDEAVMDGRQSYVVQVADVGMRLDKLSATVFADFSRASLQKMIDDGLLTVNGRQLKAKYAVQLHDMIELVAKKNDELMDLPEEMALAIVYEDEDVLVVNKAVGLVVHAGAGNRTGTLVNGLLFYNPDLACLPRAGLVHRIDKDTSGLLIVAKTKHAYLHLTNQLKDKSVYREYICVVAGDYQALRTQSKIDLPIGRHRTVRTKMAVKYGGKPAITHIKTITPLVGNCHLLHVMLETGRTHQIRVHLSHIGCPLIGDQVYGQPIKVHDDLTKDQLDAIRNFNRQALHAHKLGFVHPIRHEQIVVHASLPKDMADLIALLQ